VTVYVHAIIANNSPFADESCPITTRATLLRACALIQFGIYFSRWSRYREISRSAPWGRRPTDRTSCFCRDKRRKRTRRGRYLIILFICSDKLKDKRIKEGNATLSATKQRSSGYKKAELFACMSNSYRKQTGLPRFPDNLISILAIVIRRERCSRTIYLTIASRLFAIFWIPSIPIMSIVSPGLLLNVWARICARNITSDFLQIIGSSPKLSPAPWTISRLSYVYIYIALRID